LALKESFKELAMPLLKNDSSWFREQNLLRKIASKILYHHPSVDHSRQEQLIKEAFLKKRYLLPLADQPIANDA
jgi:hypothetical protein